MILFCVNDIMTPVVLKHSVIKKTNQTGPLHRQMATLSGLKKWKLLSVVTNIDKQLFMYRNCFESV